MVPGSHGMTTSTSVAHTTPQAARPWVSWQRSKASMGNTLRSTAGHCRHHTHPHLLIQHCRNCFHLTLIAIHKANQSDAVGAGSFQHPPQILPSFPSTESIRCMGPTDLLTSLPVTYHSQPQPAAPTSGPFHTPSLTWTPSPPLSSSGLTCLLARRGQA